MEYPISTYEILYLKSNNLPFDERWVNWSIEMIENGFDKDCPELLVLASEHSPYNYFELEELSNSILAKLHLDITNKEEVVRNYIFFLRQNLLENEDLAIDYIKKMGKMYSDLDMNSSLEEFALINWAREDLEHQNIQHYWEGANKSNIRKVIVKYFREWHRDDFRLEE